MRARERPYLPILDRSLELFARLRPPSWIFKMSRLLSRVGDLYLRSISMGTPLSGSRVSTQFLIFLIFTPVTVCQSGKRYAPVI